MVGGDSFVVQGEMEVAPAVFLVGTENATVKGKDKAPIWRFESILEYLDNCRIVLVLRGFLTDAENAKVLQKLRKELDKEVWFENKEQT
mgnify:CR=1 FL=1